MVTTMAPREERKIPDSEASTSNTAAMNGNEENSDEYMVRKKEWACWEEEFTITPSFLQKKVGTKLGIEELRKHALVEQIKYHREASQLLRLTSGLIGPLKIFLQVLPKLQMAKESDHDYCYPGKDDEADNS